MFFVVSRYLETPDAHTMTVIDAGIRQRLLRHLDNCIAEVDTDLRGSVPPNPEERLQPPDSSTVEEVNNNARDPALLLHQDISPTLPSKMVKTYDGNFVFVLPSHYVQLASALGINIRQPDSGESSCSSIKQEQQEEPAIDPPDAEKPIDFSKNNDMWRPW